MIETVDLVHVRESRKVPLWMLMMKCNVFPGIEVGWAYLSRSSKSEQKLNQSDRVGGANVCLLHTRKFSVVQWKYAIPVQFYSLRMH
jgi:hypothetical protein